jgi:hypothetical protein
VRSVTGQPFRNEELSIEDRTRFVRSHYAVGTVTHSPFERLLRRQTIASHLSEIGYNNTMLVVRLEFPIDTRQNNRRLCAHNAQPFLDGIVSLCVVKLSGSRSKHHFYLSDHILVVELGSAVLLS